MIPGIYNARCGTRTHTVSHQNLNLARLPVPPIARALCKNRDQQMPISACNGDSIENRTRVTAVKGRCLNRLTMGPYDEKKLNRQRPTFPGSHPPSIIGAEELNYCVRDGNRCNIFAIATRFGYFLAGFPASYEVYPQIRTTYKPFSLLHFF